MSDSLRNAAEELERRSHGAPETKPPRDRRKSESPLDAVIRLLTDVLETIESTDIHVQLSREIKLWWSEHKSVRTWERERERLATLATEAELALESHEENGPTGPKKRRR